MSLPGESLEGELNLRRSPWRKTTRALRGRVRGPLVTAHRAIRWLMDRNPGLRREADRAFDYSVRKLDGFLRYCEQIEEFSSAQDCLLRISLRPADRDVELGSGVRVNAGDLVGEIHFWNEHILPLPAGGPDLAWAVIMRNRMSRSLSMLAKYIQTDPRFAQVKVFRGETALGTGKPREQTVRIASFYDFEVIDGIRPDGVWGSLLSFGESLYLWGMVRTFNRGALVGGEIVKPQWYEFWISREHLIARYGSQNPERNGHVHPGFESEMELDSGFKRE